jgi:hypothetical protein
MTEEMKTDRYGNKYWYRNGKLHREDGPAVEYSDGHKEWWVNGKPHRENGPAIKWCNGDKEWYWDGERHRKDGPAVECINGYKAWYNNGKRHNIYGPAIIYVNGYKEYWIEGKRLTKEKFYSEEIKEIKMKEKIYSMLEDLFEEDLSEDDLDKLSDVLYNVILASPPLRDDFYNDIETSLLKLKISIEGERNEFLKSVGIKIIN